MKRNLLPLAVVMLAALSLGACSVLMGPKRYAQRDGNWGMNGDPSSQHVVPGAADRATSVDPGWAR